MVKLHFHEVWLLFDHLNNFLFKNDLKHYEYDIMEPLKIIFSFYGCYNVC